MSTNILACDTATNACSAALLCGDTVFEEHVVAPRQHTNILLDQIQALLKKAELSFSDIDAFAFGAGPGSFMGLRLSASVMQGLAYTQKKPVVTVSTLQILAQYAHEQYSFDKVVAAWDARMDEVYAGQYVLHGDLMLPERADALLKPSDVSVPQGYFSAGNAFEVYLGHKADADIYPHASACARLALAAFLSGEICSPEQAVPNYVRDRVAFVSAK
jgi:tRNA threonylcarbamoyladenosine biosynthesis protein TsaB